jgi:centromere protein S
LNLQTNRVSQRYKSALWLLTARTTDSLTTELNHNATPQFIAALTEVLWSQIENIAVDVEGFAKHAGRNTVTMDDVMLLARRNEGLEEVLKEVKDEIDKERGDKGKGKKR